MVKETNVTDEEGKKAGKGLFAAKDFAGPRTTTRGRVSGEKIVDMKGVIRDKDYRDPNNDYLIATHHNVVDQSNPTNSTVGRYANECQPANKRKGECKGYNAKLSNAGRAGLHIRAEKKINKGDEIYWWYGPSYWDDDAKKKGSKKTGEKKEGKEEKEFKEEKKEGKEEKEFKEEKKGSEPDWPDDPALKKKTVPIHWTNYDKPPKKKKRTLTGRQGIKTVHQKRREFKKKKKKIKNTARKTIRT